MAINFDNALLGIFIVLSIGGSVEVFIYYINQLQKARRDLALLRARNVLLEAALAKVLHYFDEDDVQSYKFAWHKSNALIDARVALTGTIKKPQALN